MGGSLPVAGPFFICNKNLDSSLGADARFSFLVVSFLTDLLLKSGCLFWAYFSVLTDENIREGVF